VIDATMERKERLSVNTNETREGSKQKGKPKEKKGLTSLVWSNGVDHKDCNKLLLRETFDLLSAGN